MGFPKTLFMILFFLGFNDFSFGETTNNDFQDDEFVEIKNQNKDCYFCSLPKPRNNINLNQICGPDPYKVVCDNYKKTKIGGLEAERKISTIEEARKKSLKSMGYDSLTEAVTEALDKKGVRYNLRNLNFRQALKGKGEDIWNGLEGGKICSDKLQKHSSYSYNLTPPNQEALDTLREVLDGLRQTLKEERAILNHLRSNDVESFYNNFTQKCDHHKSSYNYKSMRQHPLYRKFLADCKNLQAMQKEMIELYRSPDETALQKRKDFIAQYSYVDNLTGGASYRGPLHGLSNEIQILQHNIKSEQNILNQICSSINNPEMTITQKTINDTFVKVQTNKVFVDHIFSELYRDNEIRAFKENVENARRKTLASLPQIFPGSQNLQAVRNSLNQVSINVPSPPSKDLFVKRNGNLFLDQDKLVRGKPENTFLDAFFEPSLTMLKSYNAGYSPSLGKVTSHVSPMGKTFQLNRHNPYTVFSTFCHEFGHHFDANISTVINGLPLQKEYEKILPCYRKNSSIKMTTSQKGEVSADYIAASVIANELKFLPENERANVYVESMKDLCSFEEDKQLSWGSIGGGAHPHPRLRVNGIYSAHPEIRKALGCSPEGYSYEICP